MDIMLALTAATQAMGLVKGLQEIDRGYSQGEIKATMAELYGKLADVKIALADARELMREKDDEIRQLEARIAVLTSGEACPICGTGQMTVISSKPHPIWGVHGEMERTVRCGNCGHTEPRRYKPQ